MRLTGGRFAARLVVVAAAAAVTELLEAEAFAEPWLDMSGALVGGWVAASCSRYRRVYVVTTWPLFSSGARERKTQFELCWEEEPHERLPVRRLDQGFPDSLRVRKDQTRCYQIR